MISPSADAAPVASAGATFETPRIAEGRSLAPWDARLVPISFHQTTYWRDQAKLTTREQLENWQFG